MKKTSLFIGLSILAVSAISSATNITVVDTLRMRMQTEIDLSKDALEKATKLKFDLKDAGKEITQKECQAVVAPINRQLDNFSHKVISLDSQNPAKPERKGLDFCYENALLSFRQDAFVSIFKRHIFYSEIEATSATGLKANRILTLAYHRGGIEQYLIDSHNQVIQFSYQRNMGPIENLTTVQLTSVLTSDGNVISHQTRISNDPNDTSDNTTFLSADGVIALASYNSRKVRGQNIKSWSISKTTLDKDVTPLITVLNALAYAGGRDALYRDDGGVAETGTRYYKNGSRIFADNIREVTFQTIEGEKGSCSNAWVNIKGESHQASPVNCFEQIAGKAPPQTQTKDYGD